MSKLPDGYFNSNAFYVEWWSLAIAINIALPTNSRRTGQTVMVRKLNHPMVYNCLLGENLVLLWF